MNEIAPNNVVSSDLGRNMASCYQLTYETLLRSLTPEIRAKVLAAKGYDRYVPVEVRRFIHDVVEVAERECDT